VVAPVVIHVMVGTLTQTHTHTYTYLHTYTHKHAGSYGWQLWYAVVMHVTVGAIVAALCYMQHKESRSQFMKVLQCVAVCGSVLQCVAVWCCVVQPFVTYSTRNPALNS